MHDPGAAVFFPKVPCNLSDGAHSRGRNLHKRGMLPDILTEEFPFGIRRSDGASLFLALRLQQDGFFFFPLPSKLRSPGPVLGAEGGGFFLLRSFFLFFFLSAISLNFSYPIE